MRILLAGATGVIGRRLLPRLVEAGHEVTGMTRSAERAEQVRAAGAAAVIADALDEQAVRAAVAEARPEAVINQLTALPKRIDPRRIERDFAHNDRLRSEGTRILTTVAREAGASRLIAQSIAFMYEPGPPGTIHGEQDPLVRNPPRSFARTAAAVKALEETVLGAGGTVLRYGYFYGPGSAISGEGSITEDVRRRRMPDGGQRAGRVVASSTSTTPPRRPSRPCRRARAGSTTSSTTTPRPSRTGCRGSPRPRRAPADPRPGVPRAAGRGRATAWRR